MSKFLLNQKGITLVELLIVIIFLSFISIFSFSLIYQSKETTQNIQVKSYLRDEADLIVSSFIKTLYETKQSDIIEKIDNSDNSYLNITNNPIKCQKAEDGSLKNPNECKDTFEKTGFVTENGTTKIYLNNQPYEVTNQNIKILSNSKIIGDPQYDESYEIVLKLQYSSKLGGKEFTKEMEFRNIIQPF